MTPPEGSEIRVYVSKPFCTLGTVERYHVSAIPATVSETQLENDLSRIAVVPNPYVAASSFETPPPQVFTYGRGERRVDFIHLPQECTIRIYTMAGEHVRTLKHSSTLFDGTESWNLLSKDGHEIAPGIYLYHVETNQGKEVIGHFAIIK
jgi:predicted transcriptional regulator